MRKKITFMLEEIAFKNNLIKHSKENSDVTFCQLLENANYLALINRFTFASAIFCFDGGGGREGGPTNIKIINKVLH